MAIRKTTYIRVAAWPLAAALTVDGDGRVTPWCQQGTFQLRVQPSVARYPLAGQAATS